MRVWATEIGWGEEAERNLLFRSNHLQEMRPPLCKVRNLRLPTRARVPGFPPRFSLHVHHCWFPCSASLGAAGLLRGGEARHLLIHEYSGRESEPPLGSPASRPASLAAVLLARAQAADISSSCSGPNCSHCLLSAAGIFQAPDVLWGAGRLLEGSGFHVRGFFLL